MWKRALEPACCALVATGLAALTPFACATGSDTGSGTGGDGGGGGDDSSWGGPIASGTTATGTNASGPGATGSSNMVGSTSTGGGACDGTGDCVTCADCSQLGNCAPQTAACNASVDCLNYADCVNACAPGDTLCIDDCASLYPQGGLVFDDLAMCVICGDCYGDCNGATSCT